MEQFHSLNPFLDFWLQWAVRYPFCKRNHAKKTWLSGLVCKTKASETFFFPISISIAQKMLMILKHFADLTVLCWDKGKLTNILRQ